jgi:SAM-dependent methyltransferase
MSPNPLMNPQQEKPTTFDDFAGNYAELIKDPIRDKFAANSAFFFQRKVQVIRGFLRKAGIPPEKLDWLDIGCGQGDMLRAGLPFFKSAAGCDPSRGMLQACTGLQVRAQESLDKLPFADAAFDFITTVCVYHHVPYGERLRLTAEALRVLRPAGTLCIIEHNPWNIATRVIVSRTPVDADAKLLSPPETRRLLARAGTRVMGTRYFLLLPQAIYSHFGAIEGALQSIPLGGQFAVFATKTLPSPVTTGRIS